MRNKYISGLKYIKRLTKEKRLWPSNLFFFTYLMKLISNLKQNDLNI